MKKVLLAACVVLLSSCSAISAAEDTTYLFLAASQYEKEGNYEAAAENYRKILLTESSPVIYVKLAEITYEDQEWLEKGRKAHPDSPELAFRLGTYYMSLAESMDGMDGTFRNENYAQALTHLKAAAELEASERNLAMLAMTASSAKDYKLAEQTYQRLINELDIPEYHYTLGMLKLEQGDREGGMAELMKAAEAGIPQAYAQLAQLSIQDKNEERALEYLMKMSELRPDLGIIDVYIADIYRTREDYEKAVQFYIQAAEDSEGAVKANLLKQAGAMAIQQEDYKTAFSAFSDAIDTAPDDTQLYYFAGYAAVLSGDRPAAQKIYDLGTERFPEYAYLLKRSADNLVEMDRPEEALEKLKTVDALERDIDYYYAISNAYSAAGEEKEAEAVILEGLKEYPVSEDLYVLLAFKYDEQDRIEECVAILTKALDMVPDSATLQNFLGYLYADRNMNLAEAEILIDKALAQEPENYAFLDSKAWVLYRKGDLKAAHEYILRAMELSPDKEDPEITGHLLEIEKSLGIKK